MEFTKDYAEEVLSLMGFADNESQLSNSCVVTELLLDIATEWPSLVQDYRYVFEGHAKMQWWRQLPKEVQCLLPKDRPIKPVDWFSKDITIKGIG